MCCSFALVRRRERAFKLPNGLAPTDKVITMVNFNIVDMNVINDNAYLHVIDNAANYKVDEIRDLIVIATIDVSNKAGEEERFNIKLQSTEKSDRLRGYSGYEMEVFAYDEDYDELINFTAAAETIFDKLVVEAEGYAEAELNEMLANAE